MHLPDYRAGMSISTADDLTAAIAAKDPEVVFDGAQEITLPHPIVVNHPVRIAGGRFKVKDGPAFVVNTSGVTIESCVITGGRDDKDGYSSAQKLIHVIGKEGAPVSGVAVRGCRLSRSRGDNIWLEWCADSVVADNVITEFLYSGVIALSGQRLLVSGNVIRDAPLSDGVVNPYGIAFTDNVNSDSGRSRDCSAVGNQLSLIDWEGIDTHGGDGISVVGNTLVGCPRGIAFVTGNENRVVSPTRGVASGNTLNAAGSRQPPREGIFLAGLPNIPADGTITGNHITGYHTAFGGLSYVDRTKTYIGANSAPLLDWSDITLDGDYTADPGSKPQYRIDGNTVYLRGNVIPKSDSQRTVIGHLHNAHAWPGTLSWLGESHGLDPAAGRGIIGVWGGDSGKPGMLQMFHFEGTDTHPYPLFGEFQALWPGPLP